MKIIYIAFATLMSLTTCMTNKKNGNRLNDHTDGVNYINGEKAVINENTGVYQFGTYKSGFKDGIWLYNIEEKKFELDWEIIHFDSTLTVNKPKNWELVKNHLNVFSAKGPVYGDEEGQVVIVRRENIERDSSFLNSYRELSLSELNSEYNLLKNSSRCFLNSGKEFTISTFVYEDENGKACCTLQMLNEENFWLTDIVYYFRPEEYDIHFNVFLDFVNGVKFGESFLTDHKESSFAPLEFVDCDKR